MGRDINPSYLHRLLMEAGIKRAVIRQPEYAVVPGTSVARLKGPETVLNGGTEDE